MEDGVFKLAGSGLVLRLVYFMVCLVTFGLVLRSIICHFLT